MPLDTYIELGVLEERTILVLQSLWCVPVKIKFNFWGPALQDGCWSLSNYKNIVDITFARQLIFD